MSRKEFRIRISSGVAKAIPLLLVCLTACGSPGVNFSAIFIQEQGTLYDESYASITAAQEALNEHPENVEGVFVLANLYLQAVRETADTFYYSRVEDLLTYAEEIDPENPEIPFQRGLVAMGRHDFVSAQRYGAQVVSSHPDVARYRALHADALLELGRYDEAVTEFQAMADIRPDASALTRIAYVREIYGDRDGAIEAMKDAINAGISSAEHLAWSYAELGRLTLPRDLDAAEALYRKGLEAVADHPPSLIGIAKIQMQRGQSEEALATAQRALKLLPLPEYTALIGDIYAAQGNADKAKTYYGVTELGYDVVASGGTDVELERAAFLAARGIRTAEAVEIAQRVFDQRPTIYAADALAWALHAEGRQAEALDMSQQALRTGTDDPVMLFHAGIIAKDAGNTDEARRLLQRVHDESPNFSFLLRPALDAALRDMR